MPPKNKKGKKHRNTKHNDVAAVNPSNATPVRSNKFENKQQSDVPPSEHTNFNGQAETPREKRGLPNISLRETENVNRPSKPLPTVNDSGSDDIRNSSEMNRSGIRVANLGDTDNSNRSAKPLPPMKESQSDDIRTFNGLDKSNVRVANLGDTDNFNRSAKPLPPMKESRSDDIRNFNGTNRSDPTRLPTRRRSENESCTPNGWKQQRGAVRPENDSANRKPRNLNQGRKNDKYPSSNCLNRQSIEHIEQAGSRIPDIRGGQHDHRQVSRPLVDSKQGPRYRARSADVIDPSILESGPVIDATPVTGVSTTLLAATPVTGPSTADKGVQYVVPPLTEKNCAYLTVDVGSIRLLPIKNTSRTVQVLVDRDMVANGLATNQWLKYFTTMLFPSNRTDLNTLQFSDFINYVNCMSGIQRGFTSSTEFVINKNVADTLKNVFNVLLSITQQFFFILAASEGYHAPDVLSKPFDSIDETLDLVSDFKTEIELFVNCAVFLKQNEEIVKLEGFSIVEDILVLRDLIPLLGDRSQETQDILSKKNITYVLNDPMLRLKYGKHFDADEVSRILQEELKNRDYRSLVLLMDCEEKARCTFDKPTLFVLLDNLNAIANTIDIRVQEAAYKWLTGCLGSLRGDWDSIFAAFETMKEVQKWRPFFKNVYGLPEKYGLVSENPLHALLTSSDNLEEITVNIFLMFLISSYTTSSEERGLLDIVADTFLGLDGSNKTKEENVLLSSHQLEYFKKSVGQLPAAMRSQLSIAVPDSVTICEGPKSFYNCVTYIVNNYASRADKKGLDLLSRGVLAMCHLICPRLILSTVLFPQMKDNIACSPPKQHAHTFVAAFLSQSEFLDKLAVPIKVCDGEMETLEQLVECSLGLYVEPKEEIQKTRYKFIGSVMKAIDFLLNKMGSAEVTASTMQVIKQKLSPNQYNAIIYSFFEKRMNSTEKINIDSLEALNDLSIVGIFKSWPWDTIYDGINSILKECFANTSLDKHLVGCRLANILADGGLLIDRKLCKLFHSCLQSLLDEQSRVPEKNVETTTAIKEDPQMSENAAESVEQPYLGSDCVAAISSQLVEESVPTPLSSEFECALNSSSVPKFIKSILLNIGQCSEDRAIKEICQRFIERSQLEKNEVGDHIISSLVDSTV